jgi:hypothetical protein
MISAYQRWKKRRADARCEAAYRRGWDWAAGELLRGQSEEYIDAMTDVWVPQSAEASAFDRGATGATVAWNKRCEWVSLTDEQITGIAKRWWSWAMPTAPASKPQHPFARAIEAALKERNT